LLKRGSKMRQELQKNEAVSQKRGVPIYRTNPSIPSETEIKRNKRTQIGTDAKGLVLDSGTGEILGHGGAIAYEWEEVDKERFVKLYLAGLKQAAGLSKAGLAIFEIVYNQLRENPGKDTVMLSAAETILPRATYFRGLRELLDREFLYKSTYDSAYFVNIRFMFNGDRLAFVKGYRLKKEQPTLPGLELEPPPALPALANSSRA
jgi:hypothetical protein